MLAETLADRFEAAAGREVTLSFEGETAQFADLWRQAEKIAPRLSGMTVALALRQGTDALVALLAAIQAGCRTLSLPMPPRGAGSETYPRWIASTVVELEADLVLVPPELVNVLSPHLGIVVSSYSAVPSTTVPTFEIGRGFELVQFSSGTTSDPKGVLVGDRALVENLSGIASRLELEGKSSSVSWLPWSHDMGLVGLLLVGLWASGGPVTSSRMAYLQPETFIRQPRAWLRACSETGAEFTGGPDFALRRAAQLPDSSLDLRWLRACLVGGEYVRAGTLELFDETFRPVGLAPEALCPSYGCAEAALAVSIDSPRSEWRRGAEVGLKGDVVSSGAPIDGLEVAERDHKDGGVLAIRGDSLFTSYIPAERGVSVDDSGWWVTSDRAKVVGGEVYIFGRVDDILQLGGVNIDGAALDRVVASVDGVRKGAAVAIQDFQGSGFLILAEVEHPRATLIEDIREASRRCAGAGPNAVIILEDGEVPRTPSGKLRRGLAARMYASGDLRTIEVHRYRVAT